MSKKLLILSHDLPSPYMGGSLSTFNLLGLLKKRHNFDITILCFHEETNEIRYDFDYSKYARVISPIPISRSGSLIQRTFSRRSLQAVFSPRNLFSGNFSLPNPYLDLRFKDSLDRLLNTERFDLIYAETYVSMYVQNSPIPKVVHAADAVSQIYKELFLVSSDLFERMRWRFIYESVRNFESRIYPKYDICTVVTQRDKEILRAMMPKANIEVVPNGIDFNYYSLPKDFIEEPFSLVFVGEMSNPVNVAAMIFFCREVFPLVQSKVPQPKLYIVGRNPTKEILELSANKSIIVAGYVDDVRPFWSKASVVVIPMVSGTGMKNKILEAFSMEKPVVTTTIGASGIEAKAEEEIIIADTPQEYAERVVQLLNNEAQRRLIGRRARRLVERIYSWESISDLLVGLFEQIIKKKADAAHGISVKK